MKFNDTLLVLAGRGCIKGASELIVDEYRVMLTLEEAERRMSDSPQVAASQKAGNWWNECESGLREMTRTDKTFSEFCRTAAQSPSRELLEENVLQFIRDADAEVRGGTQTCDGTEVVRFAISKFIAASGDGL